MVSPRLSVNVNKLATLRNARGGNNPDVVHWASLIERFGAEGITVHPRPDARHITYDDVRALKRVVTTEFNVEGYPDPSFIALIAEVQPDQVTLVPDAPDVLTSNAGWDAHRHGEFLTGIIKTLKKHAKRVSLFIDPDPNMIEYAALTGTDRIELYTESFARQFADHRGNAADAVAPYIEASKKAGELGLGVNAGHDLDLKNLKFFSKNILNLLEVSIGHALVCDALRYGMENTVQLYLKQLKR
jgi:pyridoxine 5-phosphate synthase